MKNNEIALRPSYWANVSGDADYIESHIEKWLFKLNQLEAREELLLALEQN